MTTAQFNVYERVHRKWRGVQMRIKQGTGNTWFIRDDRRDGDPTITAGQASFRSSILKGVGNPKGDTKLAWAEANQAGADGTGVSNTYP